MIIEDDSISKEYVEDFTKKFSNFCRNAPVYLSFKTSYHHIIVENLHTEQVWTFPLSVETPVGDFIRSIHETLKAETYPKMEKTERLSVTPESPDLNLLIHQGVPFDEAYETLSIRVQRTKYTIDKINIKKNLVIIEDDQGVQTIHKLRIPVTVFLKKYIRETDDREESYRMFEKNQELLYSMER